MGWLVRPCPEHLPGSNEAGKNDSPPHAFLSRDGNHTHIG